MLRPDEINITAHNREVNQETLRRLRENWSEEQLNPIHVSVRPDGTKFLLRGQHRCRTVLIKIAEGELPSNYRLPARIHHFSGPEEEAEYILAAEAADGSGKWSENDKWSQRLLTDPEALALAELVSNYGFQITSARKPEGRRQIKAISTLERVHQRGEGLLGHTLALIREAWLDEPYSNEATTILGAAMFIYCFTGAPGWSFEKAVRSMKSEGLRAVKSQAKGMKDRVAGETDRFCSAMQTIYNKDRLKGERNLYPARTWNKPKGAKSSNV